MENICERHLVNGFWCSVKEKYNKIALSIPDYEKRSFRLIPQSTYFKYENHSELNLVPLLIPVHHVLEMPVRKGVPRK